MLNNDFKEYLEKRKEENLANKLSTKKTRNTKHDFVEDSVSGKPFEDFYEIGDELGEGGYAFVYRCHHKQTEKVYAVKEVIISKMESGGESTLKDEIAALKLLRGGAHIIRLFDVFYEGDHCFMIMEEMRGGDLLSRICDKEVYTEREARGVCKILFEAVLYCHQKRVAHRDIKPENLLMVVSRIHCCSRKKRRSTCYNTPHNYSNTTACFFLFQNCILQEADDDTSIKLADFGFAKRVVGDLSLSTLCGTAQYVAPEILDFQIDGYDERCDMWSVGVVTYILLGGYAPFEGEPDELAQFIIRGEYEFHDKYWADISESAKDMIHNMLQVDPTVRLTAIEALSCEWMGLSPEELAGKDLGGAREQMEEQQQKLEENAASLETATDDAINRGKKSKKSIAGKKALKALIQTNKFLSLGAMVGGQTSKDPTSDPDKLGVEEAAEYDFEDCYEWGRQIGVGTFSVIHEAVQEKDGELYAVKRIPRVDLWEEDAVALQSEIMCLKQVCDCDCIVQLTEVFDETDFTYMVMEVLPGGYLIDKIIEKHFYDEAKGLIIAKRLITAVEYCHYNSIAIRDLRPENMLLTEGSDTEVKLSDFGHAKIVLQPNSLTTVCGTEAFVAPEIIEHSPQYDVECDIWSLGVVLYILLGGYRPFRGEGDACLEKIRYGDYKFHNKYWSHISSDTKDLISRMLTVDVQRRITAQEALDCDLIRTTPNKERRKKGKKKSSEARRSKNNHVDKWK
jgi:calcium/calmodulin-dependent protein kinase I